MRGALVADEREPERSVIGRVTDRVDRTKAFAEDRAAVVEERFPPAASCARS